MGDVLRSLDDQISASMQYGAYLRLFYTSHGFTASAATVNSGYTTGSKYDDVLTVPPVTSPVTGWYCSRLNMMSSVGPCVIVAGYATTLGSINMGTGVFTAGSAMPTRTVKGSSVVTGEQLCLAVVDQSSALSATTPVITITYTDQDGNTGNTATITLPSNAAARSVFQVDPHLASGDLSVKEITNLTKSAGSSGILTFYGVHVIRATGNAAAATMSNLKHIGQGIVPWVAEAGEKIHFYKFGIATAGHLAAQITLVPDV